MRRILHVVGTMDFGGVETLIMTIYRNINRKEIQFDFLCHNTIKGMYSDEIIQLGGKIYSIEGPSHLGIFRYKKKLKCFFHDHPEYTIVHAHKSGLNGLILFPALLAGVKHRISHSHIAGSKFPFPKNIIIAYSKILNQISATERFACSKDAGIYLFGNKEFMFFPNAIDTNRFKFDAIARERIREKYCINDQTLVIGHAGRFTEQKNHIFIINVFQKYLEINPNSVLLLIGAGELEAHVKDIVKNQGLGKNIIFAGLQSNMQEYYSAMDLFLFPSKYEGLGIVAIEAQCSGLPVIASDVVPSEVRVLSSVTTLSLSDDPNKWATKIEEAIISNNDVERDKAAVIVKNSDYNIDVLSKKVEQYYLRLT